MRKSKQTTVIILIGFALFLGWIAANTIAAIAEGYTYAPQNIGFPKDYRNDDAKTFPYVGRSDCTY